MSIIDLPAQPSAADTAAERPSLTKLRTLRKTPYFLRQHIARAEQQGHRLRITPEGQIHSISGDLWHVITAPRKAQPNDQAVRAFTSHPRIVEALVDAINGQLRTVHIDVEQRLLRLDFHPATRQPDLTPDGAEIIATDVSETLTRLSQATIHDAKLRAVVEDSDDLYVRFDIRYTNREGTADFFLADANRTARRILGLRDDTPLGQPLSALAPLNSGPDDIPLYTRVYQSGLPITDEITLRTGREHRRTIVALAGGIGMLARDVTEEKAAARTLAEGIRIAEDASRAKSELLASMSHELRTPLNAIIGFSEIIENQIFGPLPPRIIGYAHDIHQSGVYLLSLINDILTFSRIEAGTVTYTMTDIAVDQIIDHAFMLVAKKAQTAKIALEKDVATTASVLRADRLAMTQILINLITNAVDFTPPGGRVLVRTTTESANFKLSIEDTGTGMAPDVLARVFQPFATAAPSLAGTDASGNQRRSSGLGLSISKRIIDAHHGSITIASEPGKGTQIHIRLPIAQ